MVLDLSALEEKPVAADGEPSGKPLRIALAMLHVDPDQPRKEFSEEDIQELAEEIKQVGVKQPILIKSHPTIAGEWQIGDGEMRYRASIVAGVEDIPAFIDENFDAFDQVNINMKRYALRPRELAHFIAGKLKEGVKKGEIARRLGKPANAITEFLALIDAPACVEEVYNSGRNTSPKTLYELRALAEKYPEQVEEWCNGEQEITRRSVADLGEILKGKKKAPAVPDATGSAAGTTTDGAGKFRHDENSGRQGGAEGGNGEGGSQGAGGGTGGGGAGSEGGTSKQSPERNIDDGELTSWPRGKAVSDPDSMKKPLLLVEHEGKAAAILLNRRPSAAGMVRIRYDNSGGDAEVEASTLKISMLTEAEK